MGRPSPCLIVKNFRQFWHHGQPACPLCLSIHHLWCSNTLTVLAPVEKNKWVHQIFCERFRKHCKMLQNIYPNIVCFTAATHVLPIILKISSEWNIYVLTLIEKLCCRTKELVLRNDWFYEVVAKKPKKDDSSLSCFKASSQMFFHYNVTQTLVAAIELALILNASISKKYAEWKHLLDIW